MCHGEKLAIQFFPLALLIFLSIKIEFSIREHILVLQPYTDYDTIADSYLCTVHNQVVQISAMNSIFIAYRYRWKFYLQWTAYFNCGFC